MKRLFQLQELSTNKKSDAFFDNKMAAKAVRNDVWMKDGAPRYKEEHPKAGLPIYSYKIIPGPDHHKSQGVK